MLLRTRFYIPPLRQDCIFRYPLIERLNHTQGGDFVLVSAPAGYGKTTLISQWLHLHPHSFAWLVLDKNQSTPQMFWQYFIGALQTVTPDIGHDALEKLHSVVYQDMDAVVISLINDIDQFSASENTLQAFTLVLDDFHKVENDSLLQSINLFIDHLPPGIRLVITSRYEPALALPRRRANAQMTEIKSTDLVFNLEDSQSFLCNTMSVSLSESEVKRIVETTEGWIVGLQLAAMSLHKNSDLAQFKEEASGLNRDISEYLFEEVFIMQPESIQYFLVRTAVSSRFCAALANEICDLDTGLSILKKLDKLNLFLLPLDNHGTWYRYHDLFRQFLLQHFLELSKSKQTDIHNKIAHWMSDSGYGELAIDHVIELQDWQWATQIIQSIAPEKILKGQQQQLAQWVDQLPSSEADALNRLLLLEPTIKDDTLPAENSSSLTAAIEPLTARESEVMHWVKQGLNNKQIAQELNISLNTLKVHIRNLYGKMGVENRTQALLKFNVESQKPV